MPGHGRVDTVGSGSAVKARRGLSGPEGNWPGQPREKPYRPCQ